MTKRSWIHAVAILCCLAVVPAMFGQGRCQRGGMSGDRPAGPKAGPCQRANPQSQPACPRASGQCRRDDASVCAKRCCQGDCQRNRACFRAGQTSSATQPASELQPGGAGRGGRQGMGRGRGGSHGMSDAEHERVRALLDNHQHIQRTVEQIPGGVKTTTTTDQPDLVATLRTHVREMTTRLKSNRPVRLWSPVFRDVFDHADKIEISDQEVPNGIVVTETTTDAEVVPMIRAHANSLSGFVAQGRDAAAPPWARGQR